MTQSLRHRRRKSGPSGAGNTLLESRYKLVDQVVGVAPLADMDDQGREFDLVLGVGAVEDLGGDDPGGLKARSQVDDRALGAALGVRQLVVVGSKVGEGFTGPDAAAVGLFVVQGGAVEEQQVFGQALVGAADLVLERLAGIVSFDESVQKHFAFAPFDGIEDHKFAFFPARGATTRVALRGRDDA